MTPGAGFSALSLAGSLLFASLASPVLGDGPLALHTPPLIVPSEVAGFGVTPEVAVELSIDARGVVTAVEVRSITPSTEHDDLFRERVVETYRDWRFAPATKDGGAVESTLEWRVRFPTPAAALDLPFDATAPLPGADAEQRRAAVLALPQAQRKALLEAEIRAAMGHFDAQRIRKAESPRFVVRSDADEERLAQTVADNLEAIFNVLARDLLPGIALQAEPYKVQVVVYRSQAQFKAFQSQQSPLEGSEAFYSPSGLIAFHLEMPTSEMLTGVLLHEATHAFLDRHVVRPGVALPRWLGEGFAEYVGNSAIERGRLKPGKTVVHRYELARGRVLSLDTAAALRLDDAKLALRRGEGLGVHQLLEASPEIFYGAKAGLFYASAWLLVHYLRDGDAGWAADRFPRLLLYLAEGYPQEAAFRTLYGSPKAAEESFRQYVKQF